MVVSTLAKLGIRIRVIRQKAERATTTLEWVYAITPKRRRSDRITRRLFSHSVVNVTCATDGLRYKRTLRYEVIGERIVPI
jgi:hypothetical protein